MATSGPLTHMRRTSRRRSTQTSANRYFARFLGVVLTATSLMGQSVQRIEVPVAQSGFQADAVRDVTLSFKGLTATFKASSPMTVVLDSAGVRKSVQLPAEFVQLESARLYKSDRLVVSGMVNGDVSEVIIIDPNRSVVSDHFLCYSPAISPDGRYVAFVKFYPAHGVTNVEDHYAFYDAQLSPEQNRPLASSHHPAVVGKVVFPFGISNTAGDNVDLADARTHRMASDGFFWDNESASAVFADQFDDEFAVIVVRVLSGAFTADLVPVQKHWLCPGVSPCFEHLKRVEFSDSSNPSMDLTFRGVNGTPAKETHIIIKRDKSGSLSAAPIS